MNACVVKNLECPRYTSAKRCHGKFVINPLLEQKNETLQGFLICQKCKQRYPIVQGIPLLFDKLQRYLTESMERIVNSIEGVDNLHKDLYENLSSGLPPWVKEKIAQTKIALDEYVLSFLLLHYGELAKQKNAPFLKPLIKIFEKKNVYRILKSWFSTMDLNGKTCLDLGCSVGGVVQLAAERGGYAYGLDIDYYSIFLASRILKHVPDALDSFSTLEQLRLKKNIIRIGKKSHVDFFAGDVHNLPFADKCFDVVTAIGIQNEPFDILLKEADRVLKVNGEIFLGIRPYKYAFGPKKLPVTPERVKKFLGNFKFYRHIKNVPNVLRFNETHYHLYDAHILMGTKMR